MKKIRVFAVVSLSALTLLAFVPAATASSISYEAFLVAPCSACVNPGFYNGSGNPNGGFTIVNDNGIENALRVKERQNPAVIHTPDGVYSVPFGAQTNVTSGGNGANPARVNWGIDFSIDLQPSGVGTLTLADIQNYSFITVQDLTTNSTITYSPFTIPDDTTWGAAGKGAANTAAGIAAGNWGAQNTLNCAFAGECPADFDMNAADYYRVTMTIGTAAGVLSTNSIDIDVVPEPTSMLLLGTGLVGLVRAARRKIAR